VITAFFVIYDFVQLNDYFGMGDIIAARERQEMVLPPKTGIQKKGIKET